MCTEKQSVAAYFDRLAAGWDEVNTYSDITISQILNLADIRPGVHILACRFDHPFDRCLVLNTLPHFANPDLLLRRLAGCVQPGGRITLGQCMGEGTELCQACPGFSPLPETTRLARMMAPWFLVDIQISDMEKYVVSGLRNDLPVCIPAAAAVRR